MSWLMTFLKKHPRWIITTTIVACLFVVLFFAMQQPRDELLVTFLDVGQGDAVLVTAPNGNRLLYDAGPPSGAVLAALSTELPYFDQRIAFMVASHPDADHIGGYFDVLRHFTPLVYLDAHTRSPSADFTTLESLLTSRSIERRTLQAGSRMNLGDGVYVDVLAPIQDVKKETLSTNDASVVLLIRYGESRVLLTGDMESPGEAQLVARYGGALHATVLKAGHHGSKSSTSALLLAAVKPAFVVVSVGKNNRYGHPSPAALSRMHTSGATILETMERGSIHFSCTQRMCAYLE
jgi:competence protein ComEC